MKTKPISQVCWLTLKLKKLEFKTVSYYQTHVGNTPLISHIPNHEYYGTFCTSFMFMKVRKYFNSDRNYAYYI